MCNKKINHPLRHNTSISELGLPERFISDAENWLEMRRISEENSKRHRRNDDHDE